MSASNLPLGIQFQGARGSDQTLLAVGKLFETAGQFQLRDQWLAKQAQVPTIDQPGTAEPTTPGDPTITEPIAPNQSDTPTQQAVLTSNQLTCPGTDVAAAFQNDRPLPQPVNHSAQTALKVSHQLPQTGNQAGWFIELSGWLVVLSLLSLTLWVRRPQA